jgi:hypothetical protein
VEESVGGSFALQEQPRERGQTQQWDQALESEREPVLPLSRSAPELRGAPSAHFGDRQTMIHDGEYNI